MKPSTLISFFLVGILALTSIFFYANYQITKTEYYEYRSGIFTRAYESILSDLTTYLKTEDETIASRVVARLAELPLSDGEIESARKLASDMAAGAYDSEARFRALSYSEDLLRYLSGHRTQAYTESWRAAGMGLPSYPEADLPVAALPEEGPDPASLRKEKAIRLLKNNSLIAYTREQNGITLYGYRTASAYVELTGNGRLCRMLRSPGKGDAFFSEADCQTAAEAFLREQTDQAYTFAVSESAEQGYFFLFRWDTVEAVVGVATGTGEVYSFLLR